MPRRFKKRTYKRKQTLTKKVDMLSKYIRRTAPEIKWSQTRAAATAFTGWSGFIVSPLSNITLGSSDFDNRIGDSIRLRNIKFGMQLDPNSSVTTTNFRVIVCQFKNNPDAVIGIASQINLILHSASVGTINAVNAPYDKDNRDSYRVLKDFIVRCDPVPGPGNSASMGSANKLVQFNIPFKASNNVVDYIAGGSTISKNELFIIVLSQLGVTNYVSYDIVSYYTDS